MKNSLEHIIQQCQKNNPRGQKELVDYLGGILMSVCLRYTKNYQDAEDNVQEAFILIFRHIAEFSGPEAAFVAWSKKIAARCCISYYRRKYYSHEIYNEEPYAFCTPKNQLSVIDKMNCDDLIKVIDRIPEKYSVVFNLYAIEGFKNNEIATLLALKESSVRARYSRARRLIQSELEKSKKRENERKIRT